MKALLNCVKLGRNCHKSTCEREERGEWVWGREGAQGAVITLTLLWTLPVCGEDAMRIIQNSKVIKMK